MVDASLKTKLNSIRTRMKEVADGGYPRRRNFRDSQNEIANFGQ